MKGSAQSAPWWVPRLGWRLGLIAAVLAFATNVLVILVGWVLMIGFAPIPSQSKRIDPAACEGCRIVVRAHGAFAKEAHAIHAHMPGYRPDRLISRYVIQDSRFPRWMARALKNEVRRAEDRRLPPAQRTWVCGNGWPAVCTIGTYSIRRGALYESGILFGSLARTGPDGLPLDIPVDNFRLTYRPEPRGVLLNFWVHWTLIMALIGGAQVGRSAWRVKHGRCPICGQADLLSSGGECDTCGMARRVVACYPAPQLWDGPPTLET